MNLKLICFSALLTAIVGGCIGMGVAEVAAPRFVSRAYRELPSRYVLIGAGTGLVVGGCQEALRQLKKQRDEEEANQQRH
jgi:hypothetical protein